MEKDFISSSVDVNGEKDFSSNFEFKEQDRHTTEELSKILTDSDFDSKNIDLMAKLQSALNRIEQTLTQQKSSDVHKSHSQNNNKDIYYLKRGVIGISRNGSVGIENFDQTLNYHANATVKISNELGANIPMTTMPFQAGIDAKEQGILLLQLESDNCLIYFPDNITNVQLSELIKAIFLKQTYTYSFVHKDEMLDNQKVFDVLSYAIASVASLNKQSNLTR